MWPPCYRTRHWQSCPQALQDRFLYGFTPCRAQSGCKAAARREALPTSHNPHGCDTIAQETVGQRESPLVSGYQHKRRDDADKRMVWFEFYSQPGRKAASRAGSDVALAKPHVNPLWRAAQCHFGSIGAVEGVFQGGLVLRGMPWPVGCSGQPRKDGNDPDPHFAPPLSVCVCSGVLGEPGLLACGYLPSSQQQGKYKTLLQFVTLGAVLINAPVGLRWR